MWFGGLHNNHMTSNGRVLAVSCASLLHCSFPVTGEVTMAVKLSKPILRDCSINRRLANTERMINDVADFWKPPKSSVVICDGEMFYLVLLGW